jgi:beta-galactosidase
MASAGLLKDLFLSADFDGSKVLISFSLSAGVKSGWWKIKGGRKTVASGRLVKCRGKVKFDVALKDFHPWTLDDPYLYKFVLTLKSSKTFRDGSSSCQISESLGMTKFHTAGTTLYMNNVPLCVRGVIRGREAHDHANLLGLPEEEFYAKYIRQARSLGFNLIRFHSRVPSDAYFRAADKLGILTHVEIRKYYGKYQKERDLMDHDPVLVRSKDWISEIKRIRNHPSLAVYCLGNEINKPGRNPQVADREAELRRLDPNRLFIDTCARGEFDRGLVDIDVQHMGYFAPFGRNNDMYNTSRNWGIFGSVDDKKMLGGSAGAITRREVAVTRPVMAHEVGHYVVLHDLEALKKKYSDSGADEPWWLDELIKLRDAKGLKKDYARMREASIRYQYTWYKQVFERVRRSTILSGFQFLQLADTERYENSNGLLDSFDDLKAAVNPQDYLKFNSDAVLLADLPRRTFFEGQKLEVPVWLSNFAANFGGQGLLSWKLQNKSKRKVLLSGRLSRLEVPAGLNRIASLELTLPATVRAQDLELAVFLKLEDGPRISNNWNLWLYPNLPENLPLSQATVSLRDVNLHKRYPQLKISSNLKQPDKLMIVDSFSPDVFKHLGKGGDVLMLWRVPETRDRQAPREKYYMPSTWDRFKAVIWDRGHNLGGFLRSHLATKGFPNDGFLDFQFAGIIDDSDKISLDGFPVKVDPIIQGVDKANRDRYDVFTFKLSELQPEWTMRKFAYLFDLRVGRGRLMISAFNMTGLEQDRPEACAMFESLVACVGNSKWKPRARISPDDLRKYLAKKGRAPRIKERMMTGYWQFDSEPLETAKYWQEARAWIEAPQ